VATLLEAHPFVDRVAYPGEETDLVKLAQYKHPYTRAHALFLSFSHSLILSFSPLTHSRSLSHSLTLSFFLSFFLSFTHSFHSYTHTLFNTLTLMLTHSLSHTLTLRSQVAPTTRASVATDAGARRNGHFLAEGDFFFF
jgi:hypothetical protein